MNCKKIGLLLIALAGLMGASGSVFAGMPTPYPSALGIPASACEPVDAEDAHKLVHTNGIVMFGGAEKGTITLECPYPGGAAATYDMYYPGGFSDARVMIRDRDGASEEAHIRIRFKARHTNSIDVSPWHDSDVDGDNTRTTFRLDSTASTIGPQILDPETVGHFEVQLYRATTSSVRPQFAGIVLDDISNLYYMMEP